MRPMRPGRRGQPGPGARSGEARGSGFIVDGDKIECPLHQGTFDIATGKAVGIPCKIDLRTYAVKVENGNIFIKE